MTAVLDVLAIQAKFVEQGIGCQCISRVRKVDRCIRTVAAEPWLRLRRSFNNNVNVY